MTTLLTLTIALPLAGAVILLLGGRATDAWGHLLGCATAIASFVCGTVLFAHLLGRPADDRVLNSSLFSWVEVGALKVDFGLRLDALSVCFVLLITGVGALIHLYSIGYMAHDPDRRRFFAYLNLFVAAMLVLVLADNYLGLYLGWEGVGLASYLLIGFWSYKPTAATAAKKAFVVNRVGDIGLTIALMVMFATVGSVGFDAVFDAVPRMSETTTNTVGLLLLLAACGKSAQVPLQSWLGDAMEGPTPVSALIHAATMVTAGVYLIVRSGPVFNAAPGAQTAVVIVGAVTLLFGAIIGCAKDDIKKALAASTMSQIGYMVLAAGLGPAGYAVAILHLLTHGFFKAGLFLGAGSVMHAMNDETDMRRFGGLRALLPVTFVTFGLGYLAIIGVPPFSGFFSKDAIIETAFDAGGLRGVLLGGAALLGAGITAFYMTRVMLLTFFGERRWEQTNTHPHESPAVMTWPMIVLAVGSVAAGAALTIGDRLGHWLEPVVGVAKSEHAIPAWVTTTLALGAVAVGVAVAYRQYATRAVPLTAPQDVSALTVAARRDLYGDAVNEAAFMRTGARLTRSMVAVDDTVIEGSAGGLATLVRRGSDELRGLQTGYARSYALAMLAGTVLLAGAVLVLAVAR
jgi:NADH-quinone oxidoreductase subunit L